MPLTFCQCSRKAAWSVQKLDWSRCCIERHGMVKKKVKKKKNIITLQKTTACSIKKTCIEGGQLIFPIKNSFIPQRTKYLIFPDKDIKALIHTYMYQPTYFPIYTKYNFKFAIDMFPTAAFSFSGEGVRHLNLLWQNFLRAYQENHWLLFTFLIFFLWMLLVL